ncbi:MAG: hypothetical protein DRP80_04580 [Candidatus Omnitrophota bacterium]|nr:MAG: hypothetical protein DRP69_04255 [Candidatus Omnitrophota bacterium]RKY43688.1 MAG: hypothetical protein DRP80_04580 [Candidatus Omnitrophota bacterium]
MEEFFRRELARKYRWAGKIRFITSLLFFFFLIFLKFLGGYSYLNPYLISLILIEAFLNQPYPLFLKKVDIFRFQYYQMFIDIIVITWLIYYLGGLEAKVVSLGYYAVILWAGFISGKKAVVFATLSSASLFTLVVLGLYLGFLPSWGLVKTSLGLGEVSSFLFGNLSFLFSFGYFSLKSSHLIKDLERQRFRDFLKYNNRFLTVGYLLSGLIHDILNYLLSIRGYIQILYEKFGNLEELGKIEEQEEKIRRLVSEASTFSNVSEEKPSLINPNLLLEETLTLVYPLLRMYNIRVIKDFEAEESILVKSQVLKEGFLYIILELAERIGGQGTIFISTQNLEEGLEVIFKKKPGLKRRESLTPFEDTPSFRRESVFQMLSQLGLEVVEGKDRIVIRFTKK